MSNLESLIHSKPRPRSQRSKGLCIPLQLLLIPVTLPLVPLILVILAWVELRRTQGQSELFKSDREPPETSGQDRDSRSAAPAQGRSIRADTPPPTPRCTRSYQHQGLDELTSRPPVPAASSSFSRRSSQSSGSVDSVAAPNSADTSPLGGSEAYDTVPEEAVPAAKNSMSQGTGAAATTTAHPGKEDLPTGSVSPQTRASGDLTFLAHVTDEQLADRNNDEEDSENTKMIKRRTLTMREEGVRVRVSYSQLAKPASAWKGAPQEDGASIAATAGSSPPSTPGPHTPPTPSSGSGSPTGDGILSLVVAPPHTPVSGNDVAVATPRSPSPQEQEQVQGVPPVLPTSGNDAGAALVKIEEKLLAVPVDAVSRRLLIDGRAILQQKIRTPRSASSLNGGGGSSHAHTLSDGGKPSSGYPSDLME